MGYPLADFGWGRRPCRPCHLATPPHRLAGEDASAPRGKPWPLRHLARLMAAVEPASGGTVQRIALAGATTAPGYQGTTAPGYQGTVADDQPIPARACPRQMAAPAARRRPPQAREGGADRHLMAEPTPLNAQAWT